MRALPAALLVSVALHGAAIAWVRLAPGDAKQLPPVARAAVEIVPPAAVSPEPMVVALLDDHTVVPALPPPAHPGSTKSPLSPKIVASTRVEPETRLVQPTPEPPQPHNPWMSMRQPERPTIERGPSSTFLDHFVANSRPLAPKDIATEAIGDDLARAESQLSNPRWIANASPDQVTAARISAMEARDELANHELKPDGAGTKSEHDTFRIRFAPDGTAKITDKQNLRVVKFHGVPIGAVFDVTDWQMRKHGVDPYASEKLKILDETRDERVAIGKRYRTQQLARTPEYVQKNLAALWASITDTAERKQALFDLWDECAEGAGDDELAAAGHTAREHIVGFIRSKLPEGSAGAFTADDIARMNTRRKSREAFAPY